MQKFLARQPIFNGRRAVFGYELLFRSNLENFFSHPQPDVAAATTADDLFLFGVDHLTQGRRAFLNCTREFLVRDYAALLPKERVVIEVLETVRIDDELIAACQRLKEAGYQIALDDFPSTPKWQPLVELADFIKVDVLATPPEVQLQLARKFARSSVRLVAEKVESYEVFERTQRLGYSFFQGYFFCKPQMLSRQDVPAYKLNYLRVLQAVNRAQIDRDEVAERIKAEASLSYRLLRYLNSPMFALVANVRSIPHALALLGEWGIRKWVSLVAIACMGEDKPQELIVLPLIRARLCELLADVARMKELSDDLFLLGLLSSMDAILDMSMEKVVEEIAIRKEIRDALLGRDNQFRRVMDVALLYETGSWDGLDEAAARLKIDSEAIPDRFIEAVDWAGSTLRGQRTNDSAGPTEAGESVAQDSKPEPL